MNKSRSNVTRIARQIRRTVDTNKLYRALKDSTVDRKILLLCMEVEPHKIREFERSNYGNEDRAFMDSLEYFLKNCSEEGREWDKVIDALQVNKDMKTAENIQQILAVDVAGSSTSINPKAGINQAEIQLDGAGTEFYCNFVLPEIDEEKRVEYLKKLKSKAKKKYNAAQRDIEDCHFDIHRALDSEHEKAKRLLSSYKQRFEKSGDKLERDIQDMIETTTAHQKKVQDAISRLRRGDCSGLATVKESSSDIVDLERLKRRTDKSLERYKRNTHKTYTRASIQDNVTEELQDILIIKTQVCTNVDIDDEEYAYAGVSNNR